MLVSAVMSVVIGQGFAGEFQAGIDQMINKVDPTINMGLEVIDLNTGENLYSRNVNKLLLPASNMKLISDAAAYLSLGPDYRFQTTLSTNASVLQGGVLHGPLYLNMSGDPSFSAADLDTLIAHLKTWGVSRITGNVVIQSSHSMVTPYATGVMETDKKYAYGAPVAPVVIDANRMNVTVNPASHAGELAIVEPEDLSGTVIVDNQVKTVGSSKGCGVSFNMNSENHLTVRGCVGVGQWALVQRLPIINPKRYMQGLVHQRLKHAGIMLDGQVGLGQMPAHTLLIASHSSKPIMQIMADTLKPSDNLYADSLFLHAADKISGGPVNWAGAAPVIKQFLTQQTGIDFSTATLKDGSGLSRDDRLTVNQTVNLLRFLHNRFPIGYEYISALPIGGRDGTLIKRFKNPGERGMVRAKTGYMSGVMGLSGYLYTPNGHTLAFSMFVNKKPKVGFSGQYRPLMDAIVTYMIHQKPGGNAAATIAIQRPVAFEQKPNSLARDRAKSAKWRYIESSLKKALAGQSVTVLFKGNHLILRDNSSDVNRVWSALKNVNQHSPFAVILKSTSSPSGSGPTLLWVKSYNVLNRSKRTWTLNDVS